QYSTHTGRQQREKRRRPDGLGDDGEWAVAGPPVDYDALNREHQHLQEPSSTLILSLRGEPQEACFLRTLDGPSFIHCALKRCRDRAVVMSTGTVQRPRRSHLCEVIHMFGFESWTVKMFLLLLHLKRSDFLFFIMSNHVCISCFYF
uniref:Uncharacterized protein n=1 Tax=Gasterosteus aculeatus TaxID=69293 RepID=G3QBS0_GASAC